MNNRRSLVCLIALWSNIYVYMADIPETEPICVRCGDLCPNGSTIGNGFWCSDGQTIINEIDLKTAAERPMEGLPMEIDNSSLSECLPKNYALQQIEHGYCCTWSNALGCRVIGVDVVLRETLPYYCNICRRQCDCRDSRASSLHLAASQLSFSMAIAAAAAAAVIAGVL